jgi:hypothetical protein
MNEQDDRPTEPMTPSRAPRWIATVAILALALSLVSTAGMVAALTWGDRMGVGRFAAAGSMMDGRRDPMGAAAHLHGWRGRGGWGEHRAGRPGDRGPGPWGTFDGHRTERLSALAEELGVTPEAFRAALSAVRGELDGLRQEARAVAPEERRAFVRDRVLDALAAELGITRADLDAAIASIVVDALGGGDDDSDDALQDDTAGTADGAAPASP